MVGHSFGQLTALCVANSMDLADGIRLVTERARFIKKLWGSDPGVMLSVEADSTEIQSLLSEIKALEPPCGVDVACYNSPRNIVLAGEVPSIETVEALCRHSTAYKVTRLKNSHAYHSRLADLILPSLRGVAESITWREPSIPVETCTPDHSWPTVNATNIVNHTRQPVHFAAAISRIASRYASNVWLEAGSASPIIPMVQRVLPSPSDGLLIRLDLGGQGAWNDVAKATARLWSAGSRSTFWAFHSMEQSRYAWVDLPPYQFAQTRHWIEYKASAPQKTLPEPGATRGRELVQLIGHDNGEARFEINVFQDEFDQSVRGHAVLGQSLCPASMYCELAIRGARALMQGTPNVQTVPRILDLRILSPLASKPAGLLLLTLSETKGQSAWVFSLETRSTDEGSPRTVTHAHGTVALIDESTVTSRFQSLRRLLGNSRYQQIAESSNVERLSGDVIYKLFARAVNYAPYYRGVRNVIAYGSEVVGDVIMPKHRPEGLPPGESDPLTMDNVLQVAGIHVNCLMPCKEEEVFVCTAIEEVLWSSAFSGPSSNPRKLQVYANNEARGNNSLENDILALDPITGEVVAFILGAKFTAVPLSSLRKVLSKLNDPTQAIPSNQPVVAQPSLPGSALSVVRHEPNGANGVNGAVGQDDHIISSTSGTGSKAALLASSSPSHANRMEALRQMLSDILGVPLAEIQSGSSLVDLGVDSLMITEIASEINQRFDLTISVSVLQDLTDLQSLLQRLQPMLPVTAQLPDVDDSVSSGQIIDDSMVMVSAAWLSNNRGAYDQVVKEAGLDQFREIVYPLQAQLVVAYVTEAFALLGCDLRTLSAGDVLPRITYLPKHQKVMNQIFNILEDAGLVLRQDGGNIQRTSIPLSTVSSEQLHDRIVREFPRHVSEHQLLHTTGSQLADCLTGRADPLSLIFRDTATKRLLEDVYTNAPMFKAGTLFLARFLVDAFQQFGNQRPIRILELGAGTGSTTSFLLQQLTTTQQSFEYMFTDLSSSLVSAAKKKFGQYPFMKYRVLDIEKAPAADLLEQYDLVISTNCIHATRNLVQSCSNIRRMLRPDGILCLLELTQNLFWFDLVFGLLEGWWLFNDGRQHALANETLWQERLLDSGYNWITWSEGLTEESKILRMIVASPTKGDSFAPETLPIQTTLPTQETVAFKHTDSATLKADIYYPSGLQTSNKARPVALMIHGGGHVMLSRKDVRPQQTQLLLDLGFIPVSVDYRLCPEMNLQEGPMADVHDALRWARTSLPSLTLQRPDIQIRGGRVVAVGWSTGGHLALSLGWTAPSAGIRPPEAILAFYCPLDYEDPFWSRPNLPYGESMTSDYDLWDGVADAPITGYNPPPSAVAAGGWMAKSDARSRIALHMNWQGQTLPILIHGLKRNEKILSHHTEELPTPTPAQVRSISPLAQIRQGSYQTPTFIVHPDRDDLIPLEQAQRTHKALIQRGIPAELRIVEGAGHLFDINPRYADNAAARQAVGDGFLFLASCAGLR
ncbi:uncharacterized protein ATNIH1004_003857 [Aspergillus tanneri]|uniref:Uncharacterized protein n=1 Tax=Aspergillus tanneri TaxID=1220188 RepID=A0A5M9MLT8_9EURO|nr:uncharacterized protein ATNIH1004_003857 [Aspergillus tanneri]KAA8647975.1 hypothetical protein ATNIH1004_003857 [Aspergillus tanneri]